MADRRFRVMGGRARLSVDDPASELLDDLVLAVAGLEARWSRFLPDSEVAQLNNSAGAPVIVSQATAALLDRARTAHRLTNGWFDALMLRELIDAGYSESFELVGSFGGGRVFDAATGLALDDHRPSLADADIDVEIGLVQLPVGSSFDPGGIGKGCAADELAAMALDNGAAWVVADLGGDIRVAGQQLPFGEFQVDVAHPHGGTICSLGIVDGGVATSGTSRRHWPGPDGTERHHLLDPRTGRPARSDVLSATVMASETWWAEAAATAAVVAGVDRGTELLRALDLPALLVDEVGRVHTVARVEDFVL